QASRETLIGPIELPPSLTFAAKQIAGLRYGVNWDELNYLADAEKLEAPFLVFHGEQDQTVPISTSVAFAKERSDIVTLVRCPDADHIECWNLDPSAVD